MSEIEQRVHEILNSPIGCKFVSSVQEWGLVPETVAEPRNSFWLVAEAATCFDRNSDRRDALARDALEQGLRLAPLAHALLSHPDTSWWFDGPDLEHQAWISHFGDPLDTSAWPRPTSPNGSWSKFTQKPWSEVTSTLRNGDASLIIGYDAQVVDMILIPRKTRYWALQLPPNAKVYQVHGPADWHKLCVSYPDYGEDDLGKRDGRLVPDWGAVSEEWEGVNLSLGGALTAEQVRFESSAGWTMLDYWHVEQTYWLRAMDSTSNRLMNYEGQDRPSCMQGARR